MSDAAERAAARRAKILARGNDRMQYLFGVKDSLEHDKPAQPEPVVEQPAPEVPAVPLTAAEKSAARRAKILARSGNRMDYLFGRQAELQSQSAETKSDLEASHIHSAAGVSPSSISGEPYSSPDAAEPLSTTSTPAPSTQDEEKESEPTKAQPEKLAELSPVLDVKSPSSAPSLSKSPLSGSTQPVSVTTSSPSKPTEPAASSRSRSLFSRTDFNLLFSLAFGLCLGLGLLSSPALTSYFSSSVSPFGWVKDLSSQLALPLVLVLFLLLQFSSRLASFLTNKMFLSSPSSTTSASTAAASSASSPAPVMDDPTLMFDTFLGSRHQANRSEIVTRNQATPSGSNGALDLVSSVLSMVSGFAAWSQQLRATFDGLCVMLVAAVLTQAILGAVNQFLVA